MPLPRLIPCLDVADGRVVKGVSFVGLRDVGDPVELARHYSAGGADELVFLDITATPHGADTLVDVVERVADVIEIPFTVGGGIRTLDDASRIIEAGADRVSVNSAAISEPELITRIAERFGSQAVVVAIDAGTEVVYTHGGRRPSELRTVPWAVEAAARGAGEICSPPSPATASAPGTTWSSRPPFVTRSTFRSLPRAERDQRPTSPRLCE